MGPGGVLLHMKISEIRNKFFGLSDLKGLISESTLGEKMNWTNFFQDYPQFLDDRYALEKQEQFWPDEELMNAIANYPGSSYPYVSDKGQVATLSNDTKKNIFKAFRNNRLINMGQKQGKTKKADKLISIDGFTQDSADFSGADKPTTLMRTPFEYLEMFFKQNFNGNLLNYREGESITDYLEGIRNFANEAYDVLKIDAFNASNLVWDSNNPSFFLFLLFYYVDHCKKNGRSNRNMTEDYINAIESPEIKEAVEQMVFGVREESVDAIVNRDILNPVGLNFFDEMTEDGLGKLVSLYFTNGNIEPIKRLQINVTSDVLEKNTQYLGNAVLVSWYICNFSNDRKIDELKDILGNSFNGGGNSSIIRSMSYRSRYDKGSEVFNKMAMAYNSSVSGIFDLLNSISLTDVHNAVKNVVKTFGATDNIEAFRAALNAYGNFELPPYDSEASLTPAERFILFARNTCGLLESKVAEKYGSYTILTPETIFIPAGEGLELLKGDANFNRLKENRTRRQLLENIYADESKETEEWNFCDLLSDDYFAGDKTQRAIYYFFKSNSDPNSSEWEYEFNRGKKENRVDNELGNQSIDIMCHYGDSKEKTACFEYEGEQHFHPMSVRPNDVLVNTYAVRFYNELKNNILNRYIEAFQQSGSENKWESIDVYDSIMKEEYHNSFNKLAGVPFKKAYDMVFKGYNLKTLSNLNYSKNRLNEAAADRDYTVDELLAYMFVLLCNWENLRLPDRYAHLNFPNIYGKVSLNSSIPYLGSPKRYVEELHVYHQKISDKQKSDILKSRNWVISYIVPGGNSITQEDFDEIKPLANPEGAVFRWRDDEKESILNFMKEIGIPVIEKETISESLFEEIVKELLRDSSLQ